MAAPRVTKDVVIETIKVVEDCLRDGFAPPNSIGTHQPAAYYEAGRRMNGLSEAAIRRRLKRGKDLYGLEPDWSLWRDPNAGVIVRTQAPRTRAIPPVQVEHAPAIEGEVYDVLCIGDLHDSPHIPDKSRFEWIGKYANEKRPPYIRQIGDWGTFDSCSQYDNYGTIKGREKPSFEQDIESLEESIGALISQFDKDYRPDCEVNLGNHDNRPWQWEDAHPEVEGMMALRVEQAFARGRFRVTPYREWSFLGGVGFTHFPMNIMGKPFGGENPENQIANKAMFSCVIGHTHKRKVLAIPKIGPQKRITVLNLGSALPQGHVEDYALGSMTGWSYGVFLVRIQGGDIQSEKFVSMDELRERYG